MKLKLPFKLLFTGVIKGALLNPMSGVELLKTNEPLLLRGMIGASAITVALLWWSPPPFRVTVVEGGVRETEDEVEAIFSLDENKLFLLFS